jgi:uncharacterized protein DUF2845
MGWLFTPSLTLLLSWGKSAVRQRNFAPHAGFLPVKDKEGLPAMRTLLIALTFVVGCLEPTPAGAFYCGNRLVSPGERQTVVWYKCGEPDLRSWRVHYRTPSAARGFGLGAHHFGFGTHRCDETANSGAGPVVVEVWVYNLGSRRFLQELSFEDGCLIYIEPLGYGY